MSKPGVRVAPTRTVALKSVGADVVLELGGSSADLIADAVRDSWAWCLADPEVAHGESTRLEAVLDDDPAVIDDARQRGAIGATDLDALMHLLAQTITVAGIDQQAGRLLMLHAAAVADPGSRRAVVAVAASGGGKTTFARVLGRDRAYLTDETVAMREDFSIEPYPKPLSIHTAGVNLKDHASPGDFGMVRPTGDYTLTALWVLERAAIPTPPRLEPIPRLQAITTLAPHASYLSSLPEPLHRLVAAIDAAGGLFRAVYHEAEDLLPLVDAALDVER